MMQKNPSGYFTSALLSRAPGVIHGFSTRALGDMRNPMRRNAFLKILSLDDAVFAMPEQVHGSDVTVIGSSETFGEQYKGVDGLVGLRHGIGVLVADCVPLVAVDPNARIIGVAHAGWKGTEAGIAVKLIETMTTAGAKKENILFWIGPHIGMCCYDVSYERAERFLMRFNKDPKVVSATDGVWHVDIGYANFCQLIASGVRVEHIDAPPVCTKCQDDEFYSYRGDTKETFGEMLGVIGFAANL